MNAEGLTALKKVISALDNNGISYMLGGSFASSFYGIPRATFDADLVVEILPSHTERLHAALKDWFYSDPEEITRAATEHSSFNLIHLETAFKVDIFALKDDDYSRQALTRRVKQALSPENGSGIWMQSPEDLIISKLQWYQLGGQTSVKQPADIVGVLRTQADALDMAYLNLWLERLGLKELFAKVVRT